MNINIRPDHGLDCWRLGHLNWHGLPGDVRRCPHGRVQIRTETPSARVAGPGTDWWRDLSPVWNFFTYRRAVAALNAGDLTR